MGSFVGMVGRALIQQRMRTQVAENKGKIKALGQEALQNATGHSGKFLFVAHPECCEKCKLLGQSPHFFNTPDVAFITHPNCLCGTIEAPAGLTPAQLMEWAKNPVGEMHFGWNYGKSLDPIRLTERNRFNKLLKWQNKVRPDAIGSPRSIRKIRADVSKYQIRKIRKMVKEGTLGPASDLTDNIKRMIERERARKHNEELVNASKKLRKGTTWNPNVTTRRNKKSNSGNTAVIPKKFSGNTTVLPRNKNGNTTVRFGRGGSSVASEKYKEEQKRKKLLEKRLRELGFGP